MGWKTDCDVRILTFWLFEGVRRYCDAKYDVRYHKIVQNVIQMMLECQQMIELSWKFVWIHIFARGTRWWCQNYNILTYWRLRLIATSNMTSDIIRPCPTLSIRSKLCSAIICFDYQLDRVDYGMNLARGKKQRATDTEHNTQFCNLLLHCMWNKCVLWYVFIAFI